MNRMLLATAVTGLVAASLPSHAQQATITDQFVGTWKVVTLKEISGDEVSYPLGQQVAGYVTITPYRLWLLIVDTTRKAPATAALTDAEAGEMMKSHVAWTGKYLTANDTGQGIHLPPILTLHRAKRSLATIGFSSSESRTTDW